MEYAALRRRLSDAEKGAARARKADRRDEVVASLSRLKPGDVIDVPAGKFAGMAVVIDPGAGDDGPRPYVVTADRQARRLSLVDFPTPVAAITRMRVPKNFSGRNPQQRRDLASALKDRTHGLTPPPPAKRPPARRRRASGGAPSGSEIEIDRLRAELKAHPCHACPDREDHARWGERWFKLDRDAKTLKRRVEQRTNTIARQFDKVCEVLTALEYLDGDTVTERGRHLRRIYSDMDLVAAEAIRAGAVGGPGRLRAGRGALGAGLRDPAGRRLAAAAAARWPGQGRRCVTWYTSGRELDALERDHKVDYLREPDAGFAWAAYRWAEGDALDDVLGVIDLAAGDFVRWMKQLLDLALQVADASAGTPLRDVAREAADRLRRGVVAYSSVS